MGRGGDNETALFTRAREDKLTVLGEWDGFTLVEFSPADGKEQRRYFVSNTDLEAAASKDDPVEFLTAKIPGYLYLPRAMPDILHEVPMEVVMARDYGNFYEFLRKDPRIEFQQNGFDRERLVFIDWYDHGVYRTAGEKPLTRPYLIDAHAGVDEEQFDLDQATAILEAHPWVLRTHYYQGHRHDNPEGVEFEILLPQSEHDKVADYSQRSSKSKRPRHRGVSSFDLKMALLRGSVGKSVEPEHCPLGIDPLRLAPALLETPRSRSDWDPHYDDWGD